MSIAAAMLGEGYSIVASDTRVTNTFKDTYRDDAVKTFMTDFGWIANAGGVSLQTTFFKQILDSHWITNRKDIYTAWLMAIKRVQVFGEKHAPDRCEDVKAEQTSSQAFYSLNYFKDGKAYMGVEALDFAYKARKLQAVNSLVASLPKDNKRIKRAIAKYSERIKATKGLNESIYNIACLIHEVSKLTNWVSRIIDYGISIQISDSEILLVSIHQDAKTIKAIYREKGDFSEVMMVRKLIKP